MADLARFRTNLLIFATGVTELLTSYDKRDNIDGFLCI